MILSRMFSLALPVLFMIPLMFATPVNAQAETGQTLQSDGGTAPATLSREDVQAFYDRDAQAQMNGIDETVVFYRRHFGDNAKAYLKTITHAPGNQSQTSNLTLNKKQIIIQAKQGAQTAKVQTVKTRVLSVDPSEDGKKAKVKVTSFGETLVRVPSPMGGIMRMMAEQTSFCVDDLSLNDENQIIIENTKCNLEVTMRPM